MNDFKIKVDPYNLMIDWKENSLFSDACGIILEPLL